MMNRLIACALLLAPLSTLRAQKCPVVNGLFASISTGDSAGERDTSRLRDTSNVLLRVDSRMAIDTTWRFNISERRWTRPYLVASVGAGWAGNGGASGMTTAPDSRAWSACASAAVGMRDPTLTLRGARGLVRLRADLTSLSRIRGAVRADSVQPRR
jgi:hypothetical protein